MLGGRFRASFRPLNDAVMQGRIRGIAGIVGCNNPRTRVDAYINTLTRELIAQNVLVLKTGCAAIASAKEGMLRPEAALEQAGAGLREVCEAIGMPAGPPHGQLRGQLPHPGGGHGGRPGGRPGRRSLPDSGRGCGPRVDEREGRGHRLLLRGLGDRCDPGPSLPHRRFRQRHPLPQRGDHASFSAPRSMSATTPPRPRTWSIDLLDESARRLGINRKAERKLYRHEGPEEHSMSKIICASAIDGASRLGRRGRSRLNQAIQAKGRGRAPPAFPGHGLFPAGHLFLHRREGADAGRSAADPPAGQRAAAAAARRTKVWLPYLGSALDAGVAALFACEIIEACKYLIGPEPVDGIWLGAANDVIMRERGIEFVDGTAPGFAAITGAAPTQSRSPSGSPSELQEKNLYVFMAGSTERQAVRRTVGRGGRPARLGRRAWCPSAGTSPP